jgi:hypothetical protein
MLAALTENPVRSCKDREVELLEAYHLPGSVFHQDDLVARLLAHVFLIRIVKPDPQSVAVPVVEHLHLFHTGSSSFTASGG